MEETSKRLQCEIVTPEGLILSDDALIVVIPGEMGELGIMPRHAPIVTRTVIGRAHVNGETAGRQELAVGDGYAKMQFDRLLLLVDTAEMASEIDIERAKAALARAEEWLGRSQEEGVDTHRAQRARRRALNRIKVAGL